MVSQYGPKRILQSEPMIFLLLKDFVHNFSKPGFKDLVAIPRTLSTAKPYIFLDRHWRFVACDKDADFLQKSMSNLVQVHAFQLQVKGQI